MTLKPMEQNDRISLDFYWKGPNIQKRNAFCGNLGVEVIDLTFKGAQSAISVRLPENFNPATPAKLRFASRGHQKTELSDSLSVTIAHVRNLTIKAHIFEKDGPMKADSDVTLEIPEELEVGQKYNLLVTSENFSLSARLVKNKTDTEKMQLIRETFDGTGEYPNAQARQAAVEAFRELESQESQMVIFSELLDNAHIMDHDITRFADALPADLQDRLLALIKEERVNEEAELTMAYQEVMALINTYKHSHSGKLPPDVEMPQRPSVYNNLTDYFLERPFDENIRQTITEQTKALLVQLQDA